MQQPWAFSSPQFPPPPLVQSTQQQQPIPQPSYTDKLLGKKFKTAVIIALLFLVLSNGYRFLESLYFLVTQKEYEILNPETHTPTFKGYAIMALVFFGIVLFL